MSDDRSADEPGKPDPDWNEIFSSDAPRADASAPLPTRRELREREAAAARKDLEPRLPTRSTFASVSGGEAPPPKRKRRLGWLWALIVIIVIGGVGATAVWLLFETQVREVLGWELPDDYSGTGNGEPVDVTIAQGAIGADIAKTLAKDGVTMTSKAFYDLLLAADPAPNFQPGTYALQKEMSAQSALEALQDPANRVVSSVLIPEGKTLEQSLQLIADGTGVSLDELTAAAADYQALGVPADFPSLEGFLFPAKYSFDPGTSATDILQTLVNRMKAALDQAAVPEEDWHDVLTMASIIQKEGGQAEDFPKVARVFTNRIEKKMHLESDATVTYGTGGTSIFTTAEERADKSNLYNTYANPGLPVGPISMPGDAAIEAAMNPVDGPWIYFVLVNGETGETKFSTTLAEHEAGVAQFQQWLRDHPDYNTGG